jgi:hypothetical protein
VAKYKKKRARELQHDRFRDTTIGLFDRLGNALEGRGRTILYGLGGLILAGIIILFFVKWSNRKADEARQALGRAISISTANVGAPMLGADPRSTSLRRWPRSTAIHTGHRRVISSPRIVS